MTAPTLTEIEGRAAKFDAVRPACDSWCNGLCFENGDCVLHCSTAIEVATTSDKPGAPDGIVKVKAWRFDALDEPTEVGVSLDFAAAGWYAPAREGSFTAEQALALGQALISTAQLILSEAPR